MASPHVTRLTRVGFNSITRSVSNLSIDPVQAIVFDDTGQYPFNRLQPPVAGGLYSRLSFTTRLNPSGSSAGAKVPPDGYLLKGCGWKETLVGGGPPATGTTSATYTATGNPDDLTAVDLTTSMGIEAVTNKNLLQNCSNALGNVAFRIVAGQPIMCDWNFDGIMTVPTEGAALTDTLTNGGAAPAAIGGTVKLNEDSLVFKEITINSGAGNDSPNLSIGADGGVADPNFTMMNPTISFLVTYPSFTTENYYTDLAAGTLLPFECAIGSGAGYVISIAGDGYLTDVPRVTDVRGINCARINMRMDWATGSPIIISFT